MRLAEFELKPSHSSEHISLRPLDLNLEACFRSLLAEEEAEALEGMGSMRKTKRTRAVSWGFLFFPSEPPLTFSSTLHHHEPRHSSTTIPSCC